MNILALLLPVIIFGAEPERLVVRAERDADGFFAQQAVVYEKSRVMMSRNSNFFCEPGPEATLGVFFSSYDGGLKAARREVEQIAQRLAEPAVSSKPPHHQLRFFVGPNEVTGAEPNSTTASRVLKDACDPRGWKPDHAVEVKAEKVDGSWQIHIMELGRRVSRKDKPVIVPLEKSGCVERRQGDYECRVSGYGVVMLRLVK